MRILIADDEPPARLRLRRLLSDLRDCEIVGEAATGRETLAAFAARRPDLVLLDIRMPEGDGVSVAQGLGTLEPPPAIIFVTALADRAFDALEAGAGGYLVKPVNRERLAAAIARAERPSRAQLAALAMASGARSHLAVRVGRELRLIPVSSVQYFQAEGKATIAKAGSGELVIEDSLAALEAEYGRAFLRVRRNLLVARSQIERVVRESGGTVIVLCTGERLPVGRRQRRALAAAIRNKP